MDEDLDTPHAFDPLLDRGTILVEQELATDLPLNTVLARVHHHFQHTELRYKYINKQAFLLRVPSLQHPLFGSFAGVLRITEAPAKKIHDYEITGRLEYRISLLWFIAVASFFFIIAYLTHPGFWLGVAIEVIGTTLVIVATHHIGRNERDAVEEHVEAHMLRLRATIANIR
jgi:hypothetical protein